MQRTGQQDVFFLGGRDLEMVTIRDLLREHGATVHDKGLAWGARASDYRREIEAALGAGARAVLVELTPDLPLPAGRVVLVDHHNERAGAGAPSSLRQVFELLDLPPENWSRKLALVDANDRGHIRALRQLGATRAEIARTRAADRAAQGVTQVEEQEARKAIAQRRETPHGDLTLVRLPHARASVVADLMHEELGGPGYINLVVVSPGEVNVFGEGWLVKALQETVPRGWCGGDLPERGFWGSLLPPVGATARNSADPP